MRQENADDRGDDTDRWSRDHQFAGAEAIGQVPGNGLEHRLEQQECDHDEADHALAKTAIVLEVRRHRGEVQRRVADLGKERDDEDVLNWALFPAWYCHLFAHDPLCSEQSSNDTCPTSIPFCV